MPQCVDLGESGTKAIGRPERPAKMILLTGFQTDTLPLFLCGIAGMALGLLYFGGLWLTIQRLPHTRYPIPLMLGSMIVRTAFTIGGFYYVMSQHWERAIACLIGFILMRMIFSSRLHPKHLPSPESPGSSVSAHERGEP
jgi:F1F0 ATPase subunit 2